MPVQVRPKQDDSVEKIEYVLFTDEFTPCFGFDQDAVELEQPALGDHIHVRHDRVARRIMDQIYAQASGLE